MQKEVTQIDGVNYTVQYIYNFAGDLTYVYYPDGKWAKTERGTKGHAEALVAWINGGNRNVIGGARYQGASGQLSYYATPLQWVAADGSSQQPYYFTYSYLAQTGQLSSMGNSTELGFYQA